MPDSETIILPINDNLPNHHTCNYQIPNGNQRESGHPVLCVMLRNIPTVNQKPNPWCVVWFAVVPYWMGGCSHCLPLIKLNTAVWSLYSFSFCGTTLFLVLYFLMSCGSRGRHRFLFCQVPLRLSRWNYPYISHNVPTQPTLEWKLESCLVLPSVFT
jgi:hypothetical protein